MFWRVIVKSGRTIPSQILGLVEHTGMSPVYESQPPWPKVVKPAW